MTNQEKWVPLRKRMKYEMKPITVVRNVQTFYRSLIIRGIQIFCETRSEITTLVSNVGKSNFCRSSRDQLSIFQSTYLEKWFGSPVSVRELNTCHSSARIKLIYSESWIYPLSPKKISRFSRITNRVTNFLIKCVHVWLRKTSFACLLKAEYAIRVFTDTQRATTFNFPYVFQLEDQRHLQINKHTSTLHAIILIVAN